MSRVVLALGSNLGDREGTIRAGIRDIAALDGVELLAASGLVETPALKPDGVDEDAPAYLNAVVTAETTLEPHELLAALSILQRGDLPLRDLIGAYAGEIGQTQFLPSSYIKYGVDFDGDGRVDMIHSTPDALASAANLMKSFGWQRGQPWLQEVRVPAEMPWQESGLENKHPRSQWVRWGVTAARGQLPADNLEASLILPMGRLGPAFLAYPNFKAYIEWNAALVYSTTAAYFGTRLAGAPPFGQGNGQPVVPTTPQVQELQQLLIARKMLTGEADGRLGSATRVAVKQAQIKVGLPADAYPTQELIERLRAGR